MADAPEKQPGIKRRGGWVKGQSGNPKGRPKGRTISEYLRQTIEEEQDGKTKGQLIAEQAIRMAIDGDLKAIEYVTVRLEGKTPERIITQTEDTRKRLSIPERDDRHGDQNTG